MNNQQNLPVSAPKESPPTFELRVLLGKANSALEAVQMSPETSSEEFLEVDDVKKLLRFTQERLVLQNWNPPQKVRYLPELRRAITYLHRTGVLQAHATAHSALEETFRHIEQFATSLPVIDNARRESSMALHVASAPTHAKARSELVMESRAHALWASFEHPGLQKEVQNLSNEEKKIVEECAVDLAEALLKKKNPCLEICTKENGPRRPLSAAGCECTSRFPLGEETSERARILDSALRSDFLKHRRSLIYEALGDIGEYARDRWCAKIFTDPTNQADALMTLRAFVPEGHSFGDVSTITVPRATNCSFIVSLPQNCAVLKLLEINPKHARLLPFILRHAVLLLEEEARLYLDAPIGAAGGLLGEKVHQINVADFRDCSFIATDDSGTSEPSRLLLSEDGFKNEFPNHISPRRPFERLVTVTTEKKGWFSAKKEEHEEKQQIPLPELTSHDFSFQDRFL